MSRLTLRLPETLHQKLARLADSEGVSLNQYIVYALTQQVATAYSVRQVSANDIDDQRQLLHALLKELGEASSAEIEAVLSNRELVQPEDELPPEVVTHLQRRIRDAAKKSAS